MHDLELPTDYVLTGGAVVVGDGLELVERGHVVVKGQRILEAGPGPGPDDLPRIDTSGSVVVPGFINAHTHIEDAAVKELAFGVPKGVNLLFEPDGLRHVRIGQLTREERVAGMRTAAEHMLASGTVAFADYKTGGAAGVAELRDACAGLPIRCLIFAGHSSFPVQDEATLRENAGRLSDEQLDDVVATLDLADGFAPVRVNDNTDVGLAQIRDVVRGAGKRLSTHSAASPDYRELSLERTGRTDITRAIEHLLPDFVVHMTVATDDEIAEMVAAGIPMVMCARTMASLGRPIPPYARAIALGATVGVGTDNVMMSSPDLFAEIDFLGRAVRSSSHDPAVIDARTLLASMTIDGARALQLDAEIGSISPGKLASLVVVDLQTRNLIHSVDPIASLVGRATSADIAAVLVEGRVASGSLAHV